MSCKRVGIKKGVPVYEIIIELGYDIKGKRKRIKRRFTCSKIDAEMKEAELKKQYYHLGNNMNLNDFTFEEYSIFFIQNYCDRYIGKTTKKDYIEMLKRINLIIGHIKLNKLDVLTLEYLYDKLKIGITGKTLSAKTLLHFYELINKMLNQAKTWKFISYNPNEDVKRPKVIKKEKKIITIEDLKRLIYCLSLESIKYSTIILLDIATAFRRGEICALRWPYIDWKNKRIKIKNSLKVIDGEVDEEDAKTKYSIRYVYVSDFVLEILKVYKKWQDNYIKSLGVKWNGSDRIFTDRYGHHMHPSTPYKILKKIIKKYNLPDMTLHELRHVFATYLYSNGVDLKTISELLGHSNTKITLDVYTHTYDTNKIKCADIFENLIKDSLEL